MVGPDDVLTRCNSREWDQPSFCLMRLSCSPADTELTRAQHHAPARRDVTRSPRLPSPGRRYPRRSGQRARELGPAVSANSGCVAEALAHCCGRSGLAAPRNADPSLRNSGKRASALGKTGWSLRRREVAGSDPVAPMGPKDQRARIWAGADRLQTALALNSKRRRGSGPYRDPRWSCRNGTIRALRRHATCSARKPALCDRAGIPSAPGCPAPRRH